MIPAGGCAGGSEASQEPQQGAGGQVRHVDVGGHSQAAVPAQPERAARLRAAAQQPEHLARHLQVIAEPSHMQGMTHSMQGGLATCPVRLK